MRIMRPWGRVVGAGAVVWLGGSSSAQAETFVVSETTQTIDVVGADCDSMDGDDTIDVAALCGAGWVPGTPCDTAGISLAEAICAANVLGGSHTIELESGATYTLTAIHNYWFGPNGLPPIASDVTIEGHGATIERSDASETPSFRIFSVPGEFAETETHLDPAPGYDGPYPHPIDAGTLVLRNVALVNGHAQGGAGGDGEFGGGGGAGMGGALFVDGMTTLDGVLIAGCGTAGGDGGDIGAYVGAGPGGGIGSAAVGYAEFATGGFGGPFTHQSMSFGTGGSAADPPGGFGGGGFGGFGGIGEGGFGGGGGGGGTDGAADQSFGGGGGIGGGGGGALLSGGVTGFGGGYGGSGFAPQGGGGGGSFGGAVFVHTGTLRAINSTFTANGAEGGAAGPGSATPGTSYGGGIVSYGDGLLDLRNTTFSGNTADSGSDVFVLAVQQVDVVVDHSILASGDADSPAMTVVALAAGVVSVSGDDNIVVGDAPAGLAVLSAVDPMLDPLGDNGGPTPTLSLPGTAPTSAVPCFELDGETPLSVDQRGVGRPALGCDPGAFQRVVACTMDAECAARCSGGYCCACPGGSDAECTTCAQAMGAPQDGVCSLREAGVACGDATADPCNAADTCDAAGACADNLEADGVECDDGLFCTAASSCVSGSCEGEDSPCTDAQTCSEELEQCLESCGNGTIDPPEECDAGAANSDSEPDACRTDCTLAHCGDGVIDRSEMCDDGPANGRADSACTTECIDASAGTGSEGTSDGPGSEGTGDEAETDTEAGSAASPDAGCSCATGEPPPGVSWLWVVFGIGAARRRRKLSRTVEVL